MLLVQVCLRAPHVVADEAKLAIVFTYFFSSFLAQAACMRHACLRVPCVAWPLLSPLFSLSSSLSVQSGFIWLTSCIKLGDFALSYATPDPIKVCM